MAFVLSQAGVSPAPPKVSLAALLKGPAPSKAAPGAEAASVPRSSFQALLDRSSHAAPAKKLAAEPAAAEKAADKSKTVKTKAPEATEKAKEPRKTESKEPKAEGAEALAAALAVQPKVEAPKPAVKVSEAEATQGLVEKAKTGRTDRKTGAEVPAPVTAAASEVARSQAQQASARSDRSEEKQKVFVVDRRSDKDKERVKSAAEASAAPPVNAAVEVQTQAKPVEAKTQAAEVQVSFQAVGGKAKEGFDLRAQNTVPSPRDAASFQQYLVERGYGQLVDNARIVLKDNNAGEIRMTLYPESLGKVKVSLNLDDSSLAGQIFVENQTVKDVFQSNMDGLLQAFQDGGWNDVSLQVSVGGEGGAGAQNRQTPSGPQARDYGRQVAQTASVGDRGDRIGSWNDRQINLTA